MLLLFIIVPLVELFLLIKIGEVVGLFPTLLLVVSTGALGAWLTRLQGLRAIRRMQDDLHSGRMPTESLVDGVLILAAGLLLITPGLITDTCGFLLLVPGFRAWIRREVSRAIRRRLTPPGPPTIDVSS